MITIDVRLEDLDGLETEVPVVVFVQEAEVRHHSPHVIDVRERSARLDLARRQSSLADRAPRLLATLRAAG